MPVTRIDTVRHDMRSSTTDGIAYSFMVGMGEAYFAAFALALGHSDVYSGWVASVPIIFGAILQLITPYGVNRLGSYKRWVVICASLQGLAFVPLIYGAIVGKLSIGVVLLLISFYWAAGMATSPAWTTWAESLFPKVLRTTYFARRTRFTQIATLVGFIIAGIALQVGQHNGNALIAFACLFAVAGLCRGISAYYLSRQTEKEDDRKTLKAPSAGLIKHFLTGRSTWMLSYLLSMQFMANISAPFVAPFMLSQLKMPYTVYMFMLATATFGRILILPFAGRIASKIGLQRLILISGCAIVPLPAMWIFSQNSAYLLVLQVWSGMAWATFELASFLLLFEAVPKDKRTRVLTVYNFFNSLAIVGGALIGGAILTAYQVYPIIFAISSVGRLLSLGIYFKAMKSMADVPTPKPVVHVERPAS